MRIKINGPKQIAYTDLKEVFNQYYAALCFFANKMLDDKRISEEIVEDVFVKLWTKEPDFNNHSNVKALLYISVKNSCLNFIKKHRNDLSNQNAFAYHLKHESEDFILNKMVRAEEIVEVHTELQKLPLRCRKVMNLYYGEGMDHKSIANQLCITVSTVKNQKMRGLKILRENLSLWKRKKHET
ncbi:MAG TPA: RNA polymerase sigma-70 factor [Chitinophagaceae bacterium]